MKFYSLVTIYFLGLSCISHGQNLVPNPSFEDLHAIPCSWVNEDDFRRIYKAWFQPTGGTTDVLSTFVDSSCYASCYSTHPESNGYKTPRTGNVLTVILTAGHGCQDDNYREYLGVKLTEPLIPQKSYYAEMYVSRTDSSQYATNNIGMYFSKDSIARPYYCQYLGVQPQINSEKVVSENKGWVKISGYFKLKESAQFLYIGNMMHEDETIIKEINPGGQRNTRYFVDDVLVRPCLSVSSDTMICRGNSIDLLAWGSPVYGWADASNPKELLTTDSVFTVKPQQSTTYLAYSICDTLSVSVTVPEALKDTDICQGDSINIPLKYQNESENDTSDSSIWLSLEGEYVISRSFPGCIQSDTFSLDHKFPPTLDMGFDSLICKIDTVLLDVTERNSTYKWEDGSENPIRIITQPGTYSVEGWMNGCYTENSIQIALSRCESELVMPNVITPNNDDKNDVFIPIVAKGIVKFQLNIFNRYGMELFNSTSLDLPWGGTIDNELAPSGEYFYFINYRDKNDQNSSIKGTLSVIR